MKIDILAIGVHPDDIEMSCGGTLLNQIASGKKVAMLDLTQGELGTRGSAEIRLKEAELASKEMGASVRVNLGLEDGFFEYSQANILKITEIIRLFQPEIVLTNAVKDRHPDHARAAKLTSDACFYAGLRKIETTWEDEKQSSWRPKAVYHYIQDEYIKPDFVVDITKFVDKKFEIIKCYKSQFHNPDSNEPDTPISGANFLNILKGKNAAYGRPSGFDFAEGYTVNRTIGITDIFDIK